MARKRKAQRRTRRRTVTGLELPDAGVRVVIDPTPPDESQWDPYVQVVEVNPSDVLQEEPVYEVDVHWFAACPMRSGTPGPGMPFPGGLRKRFEISLNEPGTLKLRIAHWDRLASGNLVTPMWATLRLDGEDEILDEAYWEFRKA